MDKFLSLYWFALLFISAAAVIYMVLLFHNHPVDVRDIEAEILVNRVADCLYRQGELHPQLLSDTFVNDFLSQCGLTFATGELYDVPQYYVGVTVYQSLEGARLTSFEEGNVNFATSCALGEDFSEIVPCVTKRVYAPTASGNYFIEIKGAVRKHEQNVKV